MRQIELKTGTLKFQDSKELDSLIDFGSRMNLKRGFLFVSKVLGKHIPTKPSLMNQNFKNLANLIKNKIDNQPTLIIGFAETATALGQGVFENLDCENCEYIHTTRYQTSKNRLIEFMEEHSHAPSHILYKPHLDPNYVKNIILVDDEISTGKTAINIVIELKKVFPNVEKYSVVSMLNWSNLKLPDIEFHSLYSGSFEFIKKDYSVPKNLVSQNSGSKNIDDVIPYNFGRFGVQKDLNLNFDKLLKDVEITGRTLIVGTGEFMYPPYLLAKYLEDKGVEIYFQATTRSPINIDGIIDSKISFKDNYFEDIDNFLYNLIDLGYEKIVLCYETQTLPNNFMLKSILENEGFSVEEIYF